MKLSVLGLGESTGALRVQSCNCSPQVSGSFEHISCVGYNPLKEEGMLLLLTAALATGEVVFS